MNHKQLLDRAYNRLMEIYGGKETFIEISFLNRFYQEKMILKECELYTRYGVAYLREAIRMMFYKKHFNQEYNKIIVGK